MNFDKVPFLSLLENIVDNRGRTCPTSDSGIPLIATNCVLNTNLYPVFEKIRYVDDETYKSWFRDHPKPNDMLFVTKGSPGRVCWVPNPVNFCIAQDMLAIRANKDLVYPKYLFALLRSSAVQKMIENMHVGTLIPHFKKGDFDKLILPVPTDYSYQEKVGNLYFDISEKIELNSQTNATLEAIAQSTFREWFVEFNFPGATGKLIDSELGKIPAGWKICTLESISKRITDGAHGSPKSTDVGYPMASVKDMRTWGIDIESCRKISKEDYLQLVRSDCKPLKNDILIAKDGSFLKHIFVTQEDVDLVVLSSIAILRPNEQIVDPYVLSYILKQQSVLERMKNYVSGAVIQRIVIKDFKKFKVVLPPIELQLQWVSACNAIIKKCWENVRENEVLSQVRDTLLSKLIGGEIEV